MQQPAAEGASGQHCNLQWTAALHQSPPLSNTRRNAAAEDLLPSQLGGRYASWKQRGCAAPVCVSGSPNVTMYLRSFGNSTLHSKEADQPHVTATAAAAAPPNLQASSKHISKKHKARQRLQHCTECSMHTQTLTHFAHSQTCTAGNLQDRCTAADQADSSAGMPLRQQKHDSAARPSNACRGMRPTISTFQTTRGRINCPNKPMPKPEIWQCVRGTHCEGTVIRSVHMRQLLHEPAT